MNKSLGVIRRIQHWKIRSTNKNYNWGGNSEEKNEYSQSEGWRKELVGDALGCYEEDEHGPTTSWPFPLRLITEY